MRIPVCYVVGKFRSPHFWGVVQNIRAAEAVALDVWKAGAAAVCPHLNTANFEGAADDTKENASIWLDGDIAILKRMDAVVLVSNWRDSSGSKAEIEVAKSIGLPIFERADDRSTAEPGSWASFIAWIAHYKGVAP